MTKLPIKDSKCDKATFTGRRGPIFGEVLDLALMWNDDQWARIGAISDTYSGVSDEAAAMIKDAEEAAGVCHKPGGAIMRATQPFRFFQVEEIEVLAVE